MPAPEKTEKMICPRCGAEMNHHSDKIIYFSDLEDAVSSDSTVRGHIEEFHACQNCVKREIVKARDGTNTGHHGAEVDKSAIRERLRLLLSSF